MKSIAIALAGAGLLLCGQAQALDAKKAEALFKDKACVACHQPAAKTVGPSIKDVSGKYKGNAGAIATLVAKVREGGKGVWGQVPMPPNKVSDDEAKMLVEWMLSQ